MKHAIKAEAIKFHRSPVYLAFVVMAVLAAVLGSANYSANRGILTNGWYSLWTQHTLFSCALFLPAELGVLCAWQWRLEHTDFCWNRLMTTPSSFAVLYGAKLFWASILSALALLFTLFGYLVGGTVCGLSLSAVPPELPEWFFYGWLGALVVCAWQMLLSMLIRVFAIPVGIALLGGFSGLYLTAKGFALSFPWALLSLGMRANNPNLTLHPFEFVGSCIVLFAVPTLLAVCIAGRRDVAAE